MARCGKNLKKITSRTAGLIALKLDIWHKVAKYYQMMTLS